VFSICSPVRPNPLGLSVVTVVAVKGATLRVRGIDMLDGTPILDIKPHIVPAPECPSYKD
jgi:tRNA (Thr-GGU) A37 N-methylase